MASRCAQSRATMLCLMMMLAFSATFDLALGNETTQRQPNRFLSVPPDALTLAENAAPLALDEVPETTAPPEDDDTKTETTAPPEDDDTNTRTADDTMSFLRVMAHCVEKMLWRTRQQWPIALCAFFMGVGMIFLAERVFKLVVIAVVFLLAFAVAFTDGQSVQMLRDAPGLTICIGVGFGAIMAYAAFLGFDGTIIIVGASLGALCAWGLQIKLVGVGATLLATNGWVMTIFFAVFIVLFLAIFHKRSQKKTLMLLMPFVGAPLATSAVAWGITALAVDQELGKDVLAGAKPIGGAWIEFLCLLLNADSRDVGIFASQTFEVAGTEFVVDRFVGWVFVVLLFVIGLSTNIWMNRSPKTPKVVVKTQNPPLKEPLLQARDKETVTSKPQV